MTQMGLGREWDCFDAYLFDIDGTLLNCTDAVHYFGFCETLEKISGKPSTLEGVTAHGNTDVGILRDALTLSGVPNELWRPRLEQILDSLCTFVENRSGDICATSLPHVHEVLAHLSARGAGLGVATGNLRRIGQLKLQRAGLLGYFHFAGWSDAYEYRTDVIRGAVHQAHAKWGPEVAVCVVGDTPADIEAAHSNGLKVIAVATGGYEYATLERYCPDLCLHSLADLRLCT